MAAVMSLMLMAVSGQTDPNAPCGTCRTAPHDSATRCRASRRPSAANAATPHRQPLSAASPFSFDFAPPSRALGVQLTPLRGTPRAATATVRALCWAASTSWTWHQRSRACRAPPLAGRSSRRCSTGTPSNSSPQGMRKNSGATLGRSPRPGGASEPGASPARHSLGETPSCRRLT